MKKILIILFVFISLIGKSQSYTVPTGLPQKFTSTWYWFKSPSGYVLIDTALMFQSSDTIMKPIYNAIKFKNNVPYYWDLTKWNVFGSGGGNDSLTWEQTLINQDATPFTNNYGVEFANHSLSFNNLSSFTVGTQSGNNSVHMEDADDDVVLVAQTGAVVLNTPTINLFQTPATYSSGGYDLLVRNQSTGNMELTSASAGGSPIFDSTLISQGHTNMTYNDSTFFNSTKWYLKDILFQGNGSITWDARISAVTKNVSLIHADTMKLSADNKMILEGVAGVNVISTDSISGISTNVLQWTSSKSTIRGSTLASINYNTSSGDSIGWRMQSAGMFFRGGAFSAATTNKVALIDTSAGKLSWGVPSVIMGGTGLTSLSQGDIIYGSAANTFSALAKDANATRYLSNQGTSNSPSWNQVNLANGVTGNLPVTNLNSGTNASSSRVWTGDGTWSFPPLTLGNIGASPNAAGMSYSSGTLNLQPASLAFGGIVTAGSQTMGGPKTFAVNNSNSIPYSFIVSDPGPLRTSTGASGLVNAVVVLSQFFGSSTTDYYAYDANGTTYDNGNTSARTWAGVHVSNSWGGGSTASLTTLVGFESELGTARSGGSAGTAFPAYNFHGKKPSGTIDKFSSFEHIHLDSVNSATYVVSGSAYAIKQIGTDNLNFFAGHILAGYTATGIVDNGTQLQTTSFSAGYVSKGVDYTLTAADYTVELTVTGKTATLPTAVGCAGRIYTVKLTAATSSGTVATTSSQTIDASTTYSLSAQYKYVTVQSNGANWLIIANN